MVLGDVKLRLQGLSRHGYFGLGACRPKSFGHVGYVGPNSDPTSEAFSLFLHEAIHETVLGNSKPQTPNPKPRVGGPKP